MLREKQNKKEHAEGRQNVCQVRLWGEGSKEENGASHSFVYQKHWQLKSNFTVILSEPPATAFKDEKIT